jgi:hypothetical protein
MGPAALIAAVAFAVAIDRPTRAVDGRALIDQAVAEAAPRLATQADVEAYLGELEARARRNHRVTPLDVEPGRAAIRRLELEPAQLMAMESAFVRKMNRLADDPPR